MINEGEPSTRQAVLVFVDELPHGKSMQSLVQAIFNRWKLIAATAFAFAILAITYSLFSPKWYRAQTLIAPVPEDASGSTVAPLGSEISGLAGLVGINIGNGESSKNEAIARFTSREFIYGFLEAGAIIPVLFANQWDEAAKQWKSPDNAPTLDMAYRYFTGRVATISEDRRTNLLTVTVDWTDPELARDWANRLVALINADRRAAARAEAERNLEFLHRELEQTGLLELRQAINRLVENEVRKRMLVSVREEYAFKVIDPAVIPGERAVVRPRIVFNTALALLTGCMLSGGLVLLVHFVRVTDAPRAK